VPSYAAQFSSDRRYVKRAGNWLAKREWETYERRAADTARACGHDKPFVFVRKGTPAWDAWATYRQGRGESWGWASARLGLGEGRDMPSLFPPGHPADLAEAS
jgi:hypothetical protein